MFLLILFIMNSLTTSCTSTDKAQKDTSTDQIEIAASKASNPDAQATQVVEVNQKKLILTVDESTEGIKVKAEQPGFKYSNPEQIHKQPVITRTGPDPREKAVEIIKETTQLITEAPVKVSPIVTTPVKESVVVKKPAAAHTDFNALLQKHVKNGLVDYAGFKADGAKLDAYLDYLSNNAPSTSDKSKSALAFWMNAYNAYTIKLIVNNLPVKSIMDLDGGKPWDKKWIEIGGKTYSLNGIEHDIIRPVFNEPRIHFAIVCAAKSCPPIDNQAFTASNVDANLERLTKSFINNPKFNTLTESKVTITPIMDWYGKDFGNVLKFVQKYAKTTVGDKAKVRFTDYDWSLNKQ